MRALYIESAEQAAVRIVEVPQPAAGQVLIDVEYVGICGSDLHYFYEGANGEFEVREPLIPGHELSGRVAEDPSGTFEAGQPVTVHPARFGRQQAEYPDDPHLWPGGSYLGSASTWPHTQGAAAQQLLVESGMVVPLPESLPVRRAALAEPLAVALHGASRAGDLTGRTVLVSGAGPIGLLALVAARAGGAAAVHVSDVLPGPLERALRMGADETINVAEQPVPVSSYDVVLECSGAAQAISAALTAARPAGTVVQVGMVPSQARPVSLAPYISKELTLLGTFRFKDEIHRAVEVLASDDSVEALLTHEFSIDESDAAFAAARDAQSSGKVLLRL
ncbi:zinc-binding dehydrogenase [Nesterenkonia populi]|uniref:zinc-binding dehydrogenase n=1 Tax=Nesterenkonia populi TaxID=1591087 RepID=UPI0011BF94E4|nr:zinc-binding dehydrogenase [Nesterenkonia populi]